MAKQRYVFYFSLGVGAQAAVRAARKTASDLGATVVKAGLGTMLVEAPAAKVAEVAQALPQWRYAREKRTTQLPEAAPLQRTRAKQVAQPGTAKTVATSKG